ncbi:MAG: hypothetical protein IJ236_00540, partial [Oscillospiraceae bacterium]|nr:hypothetical protein [Oscillospiraceae bacterium]
INRGEFNFSCNNETCIGIGALTGDVSIALDSCHIESDFSVTNGVLIGSLEGNAAVSIRSSAVNHYTSGKYLSGIGTLRGGQCEIELAESGITCNQRADYATCLGALYGATDIRISYITLKLINSGQEALAFGGYSEDTCAEIINSDVHVNISTSLDKDTLAPPEQFRIINGREVFLLNGAEQTREHITTNM